MSELNLIALKISGDSMKEDAIMDGDIIILDCNNVSTNDIKNGDIVAARVDEDAGTLKRIFLKNSNNIQSNYWGDGRLQKGQAFSIENDAHLYLSTTVGFIKE